jgi:hypothetical protein
MRDQCCPNASSGKGPNVRITEKIQGQTALIDLNPDSAKTFSSEVLKREIVRFDYDLPEGQKFSSPDHGF